MSLYADYDKISQGYDENRWAVAADLYVGAFSAMIKKPLAEQHLLDAGCGTGNYALAMLQAGVGKVTLLDASEGMLEKARAKCGAYMETGRVEVKKAVLPSIPYPDGSFDSLMLNHVIPHLDSTKELPNSRKTIGEAYRVIKPGGLCVIQVGFRHQVLRGLWWWHLAPLTLKYLADVSPTQETMCEILKAAGFSEIEIVVPALALYFPPEMYFDENGPLRDDVRKAAWFWDKVSPDEMSAMLDRMRKMKEEGRLKDFMLEHDKERTEVGQFSIVIAKRQ